MKILIVSDFDNGGQMIALSKALNRYTEHDARTITYKQSYLRYETDVRDPTMNQVKELVDWADFYILGEIISMTAFTELIYRAINPKNCILRAGGSIARTHPQLYTGGIFKDIMKTGAYHDWSLSLQINPMANTVNMYHFDEFPPEDKLECPPYRLMFSGTKFKEKRADIINAAWEILEDRPDVIFKHIAKKSWRESLEEKTKGHIQYDHSLILGAYASNSIEAMFYRMPVFCSASGWCKSTYPDLPVIHTMNSDEIVTATIALIEDPNMMKQIGDAGHKFVMQHHDAKVAVKRWTSLIEFVNTDYMYVVAGNRDIIHRNVMDV